MSQPRFKIPPSHINRAFLGGPLYHFNHITDAQLLELGCDLLPGPVAGNTIHLDGVTARRLKSGALNVIIESSSRLLQDPAFAPFVAILINPSQRDLPETQPGAFPKTPRSMRPIDIDLSKLRPPGFVDSNL